MQRAALDLPTPQAAHIACLFGCFSQALMQPESTLLRAHIAQSSQSKQDLNLLSAATWLKLSCSLHAYTKQAGNHADQQAGSQLGSMISEQEPDSRSGLAVSRTARSQEARTTEQPLQAALHKASGQSRSKPALHAG